MTTNEIIITNFITNYTEITNFGLYNNTIYNLVKSPNSDTITISLTISVVFIIIVSILYIIILTKNCICNKENAITKKINIQNKIIKYFYIIQYDFIPYIDEINNIYYNFKFTIDLYTKNVFYIINIVCYSFQYYFKCLENIELNLEKHKLEINKSYNIFHKSIINIKENIDKIYQNILIISPEVINKSENTKNTYNLFLSYFENIKKYINNMKFLNNIEIDDNIFNKIKSENKELYNKIKLDGEKLVGILNKYM